MSNSGGMYVVIKGDYSELQKSLREAKALVTAQATGISNALNNALTPSKQIGAGIKKLVDDFSQLNRAATVSGDVFKKIGVDLGELRKITGLTEAQFSKLQSQLLQTSAANAQEQALKRIATACNLTGKEVRQLGTQFGLSAAQIDKVTGATDRVAAKGQKSMSLLGGGIAMAAGKFLLLEQAAYSVGRILDNVVFKFNATVETATLGIASAFLNNGQYVDNITGKVLQGQDAMAAAMGDADAVIQRLRVSNLSTIATLEQLIKAYQEAVPVALAKGFNKEQVEQFTLAMIQAAGAIDTSGMLLHQMGEEMRSMINGGISDRNSRIATALGVRPEDIERYKNDAQGLFDFLMSKLAVYQAFGAKLQQTWKGVASNTIDIFQQVAAQATEPLFQAVRDGLYAWTQGIATVEEKTDSLGRVTRELKWNDEYLQGIERVKTAIEGVVAFVKSNKDVIGSMFAVAGEAANASLAAIGQVFTLLSNVGAAARETVKELKEVANIKVQIPTPLDIPGALATGAAVGLGKINSALGPDVLSGVDMLREKLRELKSELAVNENSITKLLFGKRDPETIKSDIKGIESQLKSIIDRQKNAGKIDSTYVNNPPKPDEEAQKAREKFIESIRTARQEADAWYAANSKLAQGAAEELRVWEMYKEKLDAISKTKEAAANKSARAAEKEENALEKLLGKYLPLRKEQEEYTKAVAAFDQALAAGIITQEQYNTGLANAEKTLTSYKEQHEEAAKAVKDLAQAWKEYDANRRDVDLAAMSDQEREIALIQERYDKLEQQIAQNAKMGASEEWAAARRATLAQKMQDDIEGVKDSANGMSRLFEDVAKNIQDAFADMFEDMLNGTDNVLKNIITMFKRLLAQMSTMAIAQPIILPIVAGVGSLMGISDAAIAKTMGMDTSAVSGLGGLFNSGSLTTGLASGLQGAASMAWEYGFDAMGNLAESASGWLNGVAGGVSDGLLAGMGSLAASLLSGQGVTVQSGMQAGGAALGGLLGFGAPGAMVGGIIGNLLGGMFGDDDVPQFGIDAGILKDANTAYDRDRGFVDPAAIAYDPNFNETARTIHPIYSAYSAAITTIQKNFNGQLAELTKALPEMLRDQFLANLAGNDFTTILNAASGGQWAVADAQQTLQMISERYAADLNSRMGRAYGDALQGYIAGHGVSGLVGSESVWSTLTTAVQGNITSAFSGAASKMTGGDVSGGISTIQNIMAAISQIGQAMAPIQEIIDTNGLSDYALQIRSINNQFDQYAEALKAAGVDLSLYTELEEARTISLRNFREQQIAGTMEQLNDTIQQAGGTDYEQGLREVNDRFAVMKTLLEDVGASAEEWTIYNQALKISLDEVIAAEDKRLLREQVDALQEQLDGLVTTFGDLAGAMNELDPPAKTLVDAWRVNKTEMEALISGLADALGELPEQTAIDKLKGTLSALSSATAGIAALNDQIFDLQTGGVSAASVGLLKQREQALFAEMATSSDPGGVASQLAGIVAKRLTMQANMEEEHLQSVAEMEKKLREDQISGLQEQIKAAQALVDVIDSMPKFLAELRYSDLSSLNPGDQLATAQGSFHSIMTAAMGGDEDAIRDLQGAGSNYLKEAQGYYGGATSQYAGVFSNVTAALERFGAQPVTDIDLLQSQIDHLQKIEDSASATADTAAAQIEALVGIRTALTAREQQLEAQKVEDRAVVQEQIDQLKLVVSGQEAQIRQQAATHTELMAELKAANATLASMDKTATLTAAVPA